MSSILALCALSATAIPAKRGTWKTIILEDGTSVRAELCGDEYAHFWRTAKGDTYVQKGNSDIFVKTTPEAINAKAQEMRKNNSERRMKRAAKRAVGTASSVNSGSHKGLIILVQFQNLKFRTGHDNAYYNNVANTVGFTNSEGYRGSVHDYFLSQSDGRFDLTFDVAGPYTLSKNYEYYGEDGTSKDIHAYDMITEACRAADKDVDFSRYDWDGDGEVEQVYVLFAGNGQAAGGDDNTIWPHEFVLQPSITLDNTRLYTYACGSELVLSRAGGIGTFCHEFSHCLGLPDMYDTDYSGAYGMGPWSPMCSGSYNGNSMLPANYTGYEKMFSGWQQPKELTGEVEVSGMKAIGDGGETYIIYNKSNRNEYYILENRQLTGWDAALPASGLVVTHVDYSWYTWATNNVNNDPTHQRCAVIHADNGTSNDAGVPFPYRTNNRLTDTSVPAATLFNYNNGRRYMNYPITDIRQENGLISFNAGTAEVITDLNGPSADPSDAVFYESFDKCTGEGGNDNFWGTEVTFANLRPDMDGWYYQYGYGADRCAKFGRTAKDGNTATPIMALDGEYDLYFKASPYATGETGLTLALNGKGSMEQTEFVMEAGKWTEFHTTFTATGDTRIVFRPEKHFFLDEVIVKKSTSTGITGINLSPSAKAMNIYSIDGRYMGSDLSRLKKGIYVVNGRKVVK